MKVGEKWEYLAHGCFVEIVRIWVDDEEDGDEMVEVKSLGCDLDNRPPDVTQAEWGLDMDPDEFPYYFREEFLKEFRKVYDDTE